MSDKQNDQRMAIEILASLKIILHSVTHAWRLMLGAAAATLLFSNTGLAQSAPAQVEVPRLRDSKERLPNPNLSQLARLRFLTTTDFPPFNFLDAEGRLTGFHIDLARAICAKLAVADRCEIQALPWAELQGALARGEGEALLSGISITSESRQTFAFSRPYLTFPARFVMPTASAAKEPIYDRIQEQRIGVLAGSAHDKMLRAYFGAVKPITYAKPEWMYEDLKAGKLAGIFGDGMKLSFWLASSDAAGCCGFAGGPYFSADYLGQGLAVAVRPDDRVLAQAMDHALQALSADGTMAELYLRYFPVGFF